MHKAFLIAILLLITNISIAHPIKLSTAKLNFSGEKTTLTLNVFWDDFRDHLILKYRYPITSKKNDLNSQEIILGYISENVQLRVGNRDLELILKDYHLKDDGISLQFNFEIDGLPVEETVDLKYALLFDAFDNQSNVLSVVDWDGNKKIYRYLKGDDWKVLR